MVTCLLLVCECIIVRLTATWTHYERVYVLLCCNKGDDECHSLGHLLQHLYFVQMCDEWEQQLVSQLTVTEVQFCQSFRGVEHLDQSPTGPLIQLGVTQIQLSSQSFTQGQGPPHCIPLTVYRDQTQQLEEDSFTDSKQEKQRREQSNMNVTWLLYGSGSSVLILT